MTQVETQMIERTREIMGAIGLLATRQLDMTLEMSKLTATVEAHLQEDRNILQHLNSNHNREQLAQKGLGIGIGGGLVAGVITIGKIAGWW